MKTLQLRLAFWGALLFAVGLFTGLWSAAALTNMVNLHIPRLALAAHLNGLLGGLWMLAVAFTFPLLQYKETQLKRLFWLVAVPSWANLILTVIASVAGTNALQYRGELINDALAASLQGLVVLPSLAAGVYWVRGFGKV